MKKKREKTYWAGFFNGVLDDSYPQCMIFTSRLKAKHHFRDVRKVKIVEVKK